MGGGVLNLGAVSSWSSIHRWSATCGVFSGCGHGSRTMRHGSGIDTISDERGRKAIRRVVVNCGASSKQGEEEESWILSDSASPYQVLGVEPSCSSAQLKAAFRARVKEFHPDVCKDTKYSDALIRRVLQAYEMLSKNHMLEATERESLDPFEKPECEAADIFVHEIFCMGKGCPYPCVNVAPHAFSFSSETGSAHAISQGHSEDYKVQLAVGQCPRSCIHYVTPSQRVILEEMLQCILDPPYDAAEAAVLDSLITKANFENMRYRKPKKQPRTSTEFVDWL